jgi:hypothetical protein
LKKPSPSCAKKSKKAIYVSIKLKHQKLNANEYPKIAMNLSWGKFILFSNTYDLNAILNNLIIYFFKFELIDLIRFAKFVLPNSKSEKCFS